MTADSSRPKLRRLHGHPWKIALAVALIAVLLAVSLVMLRAARAASAARAALGELQALQAADLSTLTAIDPASLAEMHGRFARLEANLDTVSREAEPFLSLAPALGWLPEFGAEAQAAPALLELAQGAATAGRASMDGAQLLAGTISDQPGEGDTLTRLVQALEQAQPSWQEADAALARVAAARDQLDLTRLDPRLAAQLARLDRYLPLLQTATSLAKLAPRLLGADSPKTYLVLAQNSDELRPTGGFISGVALLEVDQGQLGELDFEDSYVIYNPNVDHPLAPPDLEQTMGAQILLFRDANWSADFPASASVARSLYQLDTGIATDGVIAFDLEAVRRMMAALEPLALPGHDQPLTAENLLAVIRQMWAEPMTTESTVLEKDVSDWWLRRKDFMGDLAAVARAKLETGQVDLGTLAQALYSSLQEKHLLIMVDDPATAETLAQAGWDGAVDPGTGDYLLVVDSNVGWNKVNSVVERTTRYTVTPQPDGSAQADLELIYQHRGEPGNEPCVHAGYYGDSYEDMMRRCYFNYLRVYVPSGVQLVSAEGFEPADVTVRSGERATTQLAGNLVVPSGEQRRVRLRYQLPAGALSGDTYRLRVQKQPGTLAWPVQVRLLDPTGAWQPMQPEGTKTPEGVEIVFDLVGDVDLMMARAR